MSARNSPHYSRPVLAAGALFAALAAQTGQIAPVCDTTHSAALLEEARRNVAAREFATAAARFDEASKSCPQDHTLAVEKANALFMGRRFAEASAAAEDVLRLDAGNAAALKIKGNAEYFLGELDRSVNTFVSLLDRHPDDYEGAYMLGRIYYQEGRIELAIGQFDRVVKLKPEFYRAWDNLGLCWQASGDNEKAVSYFLQAIKLVEKDHPDYDWAYANLADVLLEMGDAEHAFAAASKAANRNPASARDFYIGAKSLEKLGEKELCLNWAQRAAALDPDYPEPEYLLSRIYLRLGQPEKAAEARKRFLELKAKEPSKRR